MVYDLFNAMYTICIKAEWAGLDVDQHEYRCPICAIERVAGVHAPECEYTKYNDLIQKIIRSTVVPGSDAMHSECDG